MSYISRQTAIKGGLQTLDRSNEVGFGKKILMEKSIFSFSNIRRKRKGNYMCQ